MRWLLLLLTFVAPPRIRIAAGPFVMGDDRGEPDERPAHRVVVSAFALDRDEVTVVAYARCVLAGRCAPPRRPQPPEAAVAWVSHDDALDYCRFAGGRLPTEAEWERAARGPATRGGHPAYPFGDEPDCARANFGNYKGEGRCPENPGRVVGPGRDAGASVDGVRDLAGNVWEWVADVYDEGYYARSPSVDPRGPGASRRSNGASGREVGEPMERFVLRGGACCSMFGLPRATDRIAFPADYTDEDLGFRCAY